MASTMGVMPVHLTSNAKIIAFVDMDMTLRCEPDNKVAVVWIIEYNHGHWSPRINSLGEAEQWKRVVDCAHVNGYHRAKDELRSWLGVKT